MPTADILNIIATVAVVQLGCDLFAHYFVFAKDPYQRFLGRLSREKHKLTKLEQGNPDGKLVSEKQQKKLTKAKEDVAEIVAEISKKHMSTSLFTSIAFLILYRILGTEYYGKVIAILPFVPFRLMRKLTMRGLEMNLDNFEPMVGIADPNQACSFLFVYMLSTFSVKFFISQAFGTKPPVGAESGLMAVADAPQTQKLLKHFGLDNETINKTD